MKRKAMAAAVFAAAVMLGLCASARAAGGVIEINQAVVNAAGPFPYKITAPGSYRLSGNLAVSGSTDAIDVSANGVTIDLNGFTISGLAGGATGILATSVTQVKVVNGSVTGFGTGVNVGADSIVRDVRANSNSFAGIDVGDSSVVEGCTANSNSEDGIQCNSNNCVISGNTANSNTSYGIECGNGCVVSGNTANNEGVGIQIGGLASLILHNALNSNTFGLVFSSATDAYGENVLDNTTNVSGGGSLKDNLCSGTVC